MTILFLSFGSKRFPVFFLDSDLDSDFSDYVVVKVDG